MNIAYLGWGSLVWDPRDLPVRRKWFEDGPLLPVEFCRQSQNDRTTLVLVRDKPPVRVLWGLSSGHILDDAVDRLRLREGICITNCDKHVGRWSANGTGQDVRPEIIDWATRKGIDAVVWTNLPAKFRGEEGVIPSAEDVVRHLDNLTAEKRRNAEEYIRKAPKQIDTDYRRHIEAKLGWTPLA